MSYGLASLLGLQPQQDPDDPSAVPPAVPPGSSGFMPPVAPAAVDGALVRQGLPSLSSVLQGTTSGAQGDAQAVGDMGGRIGAMLGDMTHRSGDLIERFRSGEIGASDFLKAAAQRAGGMVQSAVTAPRDAYTGDLQVFDPTTGHVSDAAMGRANEMAGLAMTGSLPFSAPAGALRTFGGRNAATADLPALSRAEAMATQGADRRAIWDDTGWFRGADDKWRFEISDDAARLKGPSSASSLAEAGGNTLGGALDHPALFDAYPQIADARFFGTHPRSDFSGQYFPSPSRPGAGTVWASDALSGDRLLSNLLHEGGAHAVQDIEGFARGATLGMPGYRNFAGEVEARNVQARQALTPEQRRATPPWETQDVPDAQQIVRFGGGGPQMSLPMDPVSRMARAAEQGYSPQPFFRGEATGRLPDTYPGGGYFSRDREYSDGVARRGGLDAAREFRLDLSDAFGGSRPFSAPEYARLVESAVRHDPKLAQNLTDMITDGRAPPWVSGFAAHNPDYTLPLSHGEAWPLLERSAAPETILKDAGYGSLDIGGRDVRKLRGSGIRSIEAEFDPAKRAENNIFYAAPAGLGLLGLASAYGNEDH